MKTITRSNIYLPMAAMILTAALVVIGLTAVRVTSADHYADFAASQHEQR